MTDNCVNHGEFSGTASSRATVPKNSRSDPADRIVQTGLPGVGARRRTTVVLVISNLEFGGAQRQVIELANATDSSTYDVHICSLSSYVPLASELRDAGRRLHILEKRFKFDVTVISRLAKLLRRLEADVVHGFLFDAEIAARLAGRLARRSALIGSERNTDYVQKWLHSAALRVTRGSIDAIIANSNAGKRFQQRVNGVRPEKIYVVHNGVDLEKFHPCNARQLRGQLGVPSDAPVVTMFASFKRQKNHAMFFRMARRVREQIPNVRFLCIGDELHEGLLDSGAYRREMQELIQSLGVEDIVKCLGNRKDVVGLYNSSDVTVLTSSREGTPNVLLESMACGVPVVATDVADNAIVVPDGKTGFIVAYDDNEAMARRVVELLKHPELRRSMGNRARDWVAQQFSTEALAKKTISVYEKVLAVKGG